MKIVILDSYYPDFIDEFYAAHPGIEEFDYSRHWRLLMDSYFGVGDSYSRYLNELGHHAQELVLNCRALQLKWAEENNFTLPRKWGQRKLPFGIRIPFPDGRSWYYPIMLEQIRRLSPDVLLLSSQSFLNSSQLSSVRSYVGKIVLQTNQPMGGTDPRQYDLILSGRPHFIDEFKRAGVPSEYFPLGFDSSLLERVQVPEKKYNLTFVGGVSPVHSTRISWLEDISRRFELDMWGYGFEYISPEAQKRIRYHGKIWGTDMFGILGESRITLNIHAAVAKKYATNMRLFEATGMGAMLITDQMKNLPGLFDPGSEVVTYNDVDECCEMISQYLADDSARKKIALAGQQRTLAEHTYAHRMKTLDSILEDLF